MSREILEAARALAAEKGIAPDRLFEALEDALLSAYKKTPGSAKYARVEMDREIGDFTVFMDDGVIAESGPRGFFDNCTNPRTRQFMAAVL